jgi:hypothetical protein
MKRIYAADLYGGQHIETLAMAISEMDLQILRSAAEQARSLLGLDPRIRRVELKADGPITVETFVLDPEETGIDDDLFDQIQHLAEGVIREPVYLPDEYEAKMASWFSYRRQLATPIIDEYGIWLRIGHNPFTEFYIHEWNDNDDGGQGMSIQVPEYDSQIMVDRFLMMVDDPSVSPEDLRIALSELIGYVKGNAVYYTMTVLCRKLIHELLPKHGLGGGDNLVAVIDTRTDVNEPIERVVADLVLWCEQEAKNLNVDPDLFYEDLYVDGDPLNEGLYEEDDTDDNDT